MATNKVLIEKLVEKVKYHRDLARTYALDSIVGSSTGKVNNERSARSEYNKSRTWEEAIELVKQYA